MSCEKRSYGLFEVEGTNQILLLAGWFRGIGKVTSWNFKLRGLFVDKSAGEILSLSFPRSFSRIDLETLGYLFTPMRDKSLRIFSLLERNTPVLESLSFLIIIASLPGFFSFW